MIFNSQRFLNLLYCDFITFQKRTFAAIFILVFVFFLIAIVGHNFINLSEGGATTPIMLCFFTALFLTGSLFTASALGQYSSPQHRLKQLLLPASIFEKVLSKWLYTLPLFVFILAGIYYFFFCSYVQLYGHYFSPNTTTVVKKLSLRLAPYFMLLYSIGHSIAFFFSHYFNRHAALKGGSISIIVFLLFGMIRMLINFEMISNDGFFVAFEKGVWNNLNFVGTHPFYFLWVPPIFWYLTYRVAKRKEV